MNFVVILLSKVVLDFVGWWSYSGILFGYYVVVYIDWSFNFLKLYLYFRFGFLWKNSCCLEGNFLIIYVILIVKFGLWILLMWLIFCCLLVIWGFVIFLFGGIFWNVWFGVKFLSFD